MLDPIISLGYKEMLISQAAWQQSIMPLLPPPPSVVEPLNIITLIYFLMIFTSSLYSYQYLSLGSTNPTSLASSPLGLFIHHFFGTENTLWHTSKCLVIYNLSIHPFIYSSVVQLELGIIGTGAASKDSNCSFVIL